MSEPIIMAGQPVAAKIRRELQEKFQGRKVTLATFLVGNDAAAQVYKRSLLKTAASLGIQTREVVLPQETTQEEASRAMDQLSADPSVTGILLLVPLPHQIDRFALLAHMDPDKDMDCIHPLNSGNFYVGTSPWAPCTPRACMAILDYYQVPLVGKNVVMVGYGSVVGRPLTLMLLGERATVTVCRSTTKNLPAITRQADVILCAVGKPNLITEDMVKDGAVIVDIGINSLEGKLVGDVPEDVKKAKASAYTPVPGGVGVVSNLMVMETLTRNV